MEKALNVLRELYLVINFNSYWKPRVDEAIIELEEAMKPKSCEGCKYFNSSINGGLCFRLDTIVSKTFYCQGHEAKEQL